LKAQILENSRLAEDIALQWSDLPGAAVRLASAGLHTAATIIARPIVPVLIDAKAFANRLLFSSKAHIAIPFDKGRPMEASAERLLKSFVDLVSVEGASGNEGALAARLKEDLLALGFSEVKEDKAGNLIATVPGKVPDAPHVLLSAHMDTVERTSPSAVRIRHGEVYTDEKHILGADDRSGIAQILEGLRTAREAGVDHGRITVVFTRKEEIGLKGSLKLDRKELGEGPVLGFVLDSLALHNIHTKASGSPMINKSVGFRHDPRDPLVQLAAKALTDAGVNPRIVKASVFPGACSDANTEAFNSGNVKSLALGTGMWDVHSDFEHIRIKDLVDGAEVVAHLVSNAASLRVDDSGQIVPRRRVPGG
jgi:putative aminopeptidase FrvX